MTRVRTTATALLPVMGLFLVLYILFTAMGTLDYALLSPDLWLQSPWVEPGAEIATATRFVCAVVWLLPVAAGVLAVLSAIELLSLVRKGVLFDHRIARRFRIAGIACAASGALDLVANLFTPVILSWHNPSGPFGPSFYFNSEAAGLILCGGGFYLTGWIMAEAIRLKDENEGFI
jgi:hypothetical protein